MRCWPWLRARRSRTGGVARSAFSTGLLSREDAAARDIPLQARSDPGHAYGTLLREPRRALHARIAEAIEERVCRSWPGASRDAGPTLHRGGPD